MHIFTQPCGGALRSASMPMQLKMSSSPICITTVLAISTASQARFHLQERELTYATGRYMLYPRLFVRGRGYLRDRAAELCLA
jgi:hypothetical protein